MITARSLPPEPSPAERFERAAQTWVASRASSATREAYRRDLRLWLRHCADTGAEASAPSVESVVAFRDGLLRVKAPLSVRRTMACLSALYTNVAPALQNPFSERACPRPPASVYSRTQAIGVDEARKIIAAAGERGESPLRDVALLWLLWSTGMRRVSVVSIRRDGVLNRGGQVLVRHLIKGGEEVEVEVPEEAASSIRSWLENAPPSRWLFCTLDGTRPIKEQSVTKIVALAARRAGLHCHPHQFRSAVITQALDAKIPLERVAKFVHHRDIRSTLRYDRGQRGAGVAAEVAAFRARQSQ